MKRFLAMGLVIVLALTLSLVTACGQKAEPLTATALPVNEPEVIDADVEEDTYDDGTIWFDNRWWKIEAKHEETLEEGTEYGAPGMYNTYIFEISAANAGDFEVDPSLEGKYALTFDFKMIGESDEAFDNLLNEMTGLDLHGLGMGVNFEISSHWQSPQGLSMVQKIKPGWQGVLKKQNGTQVHPAEGSLLLFEDMNIVVAGDTDQAIIGSYFGEGETNVELYIIIPPGDPTDPLNEDDQLVDVFVHMTERDMWFNFDGVLFLDKHL